MLEDLEDDNVDGIKDMAFSMMKSHYGLERNQIISIDKDIPLVIELRILKQDKGKIWQYQIIQRKHVWLSLVCCIVQVSGWN